jgi:hypothetical protein
LKTVDGQTKISISLLSRFCRHNDENPTITLF